MLTRYASSALAFAGLSLLGQAAGAATRNVPAQYPTIQAAVNAAGKADTILLADGTYAGPGNVDVDFGGKNLTVTSQHGPAKTVINCGGYATSNGSGDHRGFYLHSGEVRAVISGLTIENGYEDQFDGGGIDGEGVGLTIQNCILKNNVGGVGGGIYTSNSNANVVILVTGCTFAGNNGTGYGGGVYASNANGNGSPITVAGCVFKDNFSFQGGGVCNDDEDIGTLTTISCLFEGNTASGNGGAIFNSNMYGAGTIAVTDCTITGNSAVQSGGGIENFNVFKTTGTTLLTNCALTGNSVGANGGGAAIDISNSGRGTITVTNCTLTQNTVPSGGSGGGALAVYNGSTYPATLINDIVYGNAGGEILGTTPATHCDVQGGYAGTADINADPKFVHAPTDLHLLPGSPCLGKGTPQGAPKTTLDRRTRPNPPSIGAFEKAL